MASSTWRPATEHDVCSYIVKRTQIYLDETQDGELSRRARARGCTKSALIRDAIDHMLEEPDDASLRLAKFKAALHRAAGIAPYLPDGATYVDEIRSSDAERAAELERRRIT